MIPLFKLQRLPAGQRRRKTILLLSSLERLLAGVSTINPVTGLPLDPAYLAGLARLVLDDPKVDPLILTATDRETLARAETGMYAGDYSGAPAGSSSGALPGDLYRLCNHARHALILAAGSPPAEWDLIIPGKGSAEPPASLAESGASPSGRPFYPGVCLYAEDIRSPFNLGSLFRTAEAFGAERVFVSPQCVPPDHPRAVRSAMGCVEYIPWQRLSLDEIPADMPVFALETGGTPIGEFDFPERGVVIVGSEELGISPEGLKRASYGRVSIPMTGIKASLNVGVAFGILMQAWTAYLPCSDSKPR